MQIVVDPAATGPFPIGTHDEIDLEEDGAIPHYMMRPGGNMVQARGPNKKKKKTKKTTKGVDKTATEPLLPVEDTPIEKLVKAVRKNDRARFDQLLEEHPSLNVNEHTREGDAVLVETCRFARLDMVRVLVNERHADVNVSSRNASRKHVGMRPLHAACMTLDISLVDVLLQAKDQVVDATAMYDVATPVTVCIFYCEGNGYSRQQQDKALPIMEKLIGYAKSQNDQLSTLLTVETDKGNRLVHIASMLVNEDAIKILKKYGADFTTHNAIGYTPVQVVEQNAFNRRSFTQLWKASGKKEIKKKPRPRKKAKKESEAVDDVAPSTGGKDEESEEESLADREIKVNASIKRLDRELEDRCVMATMIQLMDVVGVGAIFSRKGDSSIRSIHIKGLVLAHQGLHAVINKVVGSSDPEEEKVVFVDGVMHCVKSLYTLALKSPSQFGKMWKQAYISPIHTQERAPLSPEAFVVVMAALLSHRSLSRHIRVWTMILVDALQLFKEDQPVQANEVPFVSSTGATELLKQTAHAINRSATKMMFSIFDRTDVDEDESYDEEIEYHVCIALTELFLQFFAALARLATSDSFSVRDLFKLASAPIKSLWTMLNAAMDTINSTFGSPQRFSLVLHVLQVFELLENGFEQDESATLTKLYSIVKRFAKQEAVKKKLFMETMKQVQLLQSVSEAFPMAPSMIESLSPIKSKLDILIRSDPKILGMDLYALAHVSDLIRLEHKVDYLEILADEHDGSVHVSISRASGANYVEFIMQQILSANARKMKGDLDITLVNEPGVGAGVVREFFQMVQRSFFNPIFVPLDQPAGGSAPSSQVSEIGSQWLQMARDRSPNRSNEAAGEKGATGKDASDKTTQVDLFRLFPLFQLISDKSDELRIMPRKLHIRKELADAKQQEKNLHLTQKDLLVHEDEVKQLKQLYLCVGRLLGLAIRNQQPLDASFPVAFWKFMLSDDASWEEYCAGNEVFKRSLQFVLDNDFDTSPLDMRFEYTTEVVVVDDSNNETATPRTVAMEMELQRGQGSVEVTNANKAKYVVMRAKQFFFGEEFEYYKKLREGLNDAIRRFDLKLFQASELRKVVRGERKIDLSGLKRAVIYSRGVSASHEVVRNFWEVIDAFDQPQKEKLLMFWSGSAFPPLFGFNNIERADHTHSGSWYIDLEPKDKSHLCPTANTCDRRLMLPQYPNKDELREKLVVAIEHGALGYDRM
ncbi:hypothetical protein Poli38472_005294 [Pythium oligandrum]|uniref:E3 ubiquitin-protein ligase HACE1 n=1 Tax=Pythium oligandrum TaxID=41045 RepID=A0A8K1CFS3_PYTOL|nr:hypothetical protein Poli38472_005294 [Pythium oligandrum]|eukprot:TMW62676.1 hypothetical protein Poli38472_005294 [Pythium oligandrum]